MEFYHVAQGVHWYFQNVGPSKIEDACIHDPEFQYGRYFKEILIHVYQEI